MTRAEFARHVGRLNRHTAAALSSEIEGMWNPEFCSSNADAHALSLVEDIERELAHMKKRIG